MADIKRLGFVGVGLMGGGMARYLLKAGNALTVFDIDPVKMNSLKALGAHPAASPREVGAKSNVILSSLPDSPTVKNIYLGPDGVLEGSSSGSILIDMSTVDPETSRTIYKAAAKKNIKYLDAPVSGGPKEAESGKLVITVGGDRGAFDECKPIFDILGPTVHFAGPSGSGNIVKLVNNMMSMGNILIAAEAIVLGVKAGMDSQTLFNILKTSGGRSAHLEKRFPNALARNFEPGFTVDLAKKDLALAIDMARSFSVPVLAAHLNQQLYSISSALGNGQKDCVSIITLFESWAGVQFQETKK